MSKINDSKKFEFFFWAKTFFSYGLHPHDAFNPFIYWRQFETLRVSEEFHL